MTRLVFASVFPILALAGGLTSWVPAALMIGFLIFIHELGHFLVAKWMGMPVEVFSLGFGPRLFGFKWKETDLRLSALPLGGYVKLLGFNPEEPEADDPHGFLSQPAWKRQLFYAGGIVFNVATCLILMWVVSTDRARITGSHPLPSPLGVMEVVPGSAAEKGGLLKGDEVQAFGELKFPGASSDDAVAFIQARPGKSIETLIMREGHPLALRLTPEDQGGKGKLGIHFRPTQFTYERRALQVGDFGRGAVESVRISASMAAQIGNGFFRLFTFRQNVKELGGPIAIVRMGNEAAKAGWEAYLLITALISMNLAVLNALPIPFLDGGHMALLGFEKLRGKDLSLAVKEHLLMGGFVLLASLMVLVLFLDIWKLRH
jgi:regulator of sigma E protease